jgi:xylulokinase
MASAFLGIDLGTSGTKALVLSVSGKVLATATASHPLHMPKPGWSEQQPADWWKSTRKAVKAALNKAGKAGSNIAAIGVAGQMHGSVFLNQFGQPISPALLWNDQRTTAECEEITRRAGGNKALIRMVQNIALTGYTAPKILWLRNNQPRLFKALHRVLLPKDYINYQLTGEQVCEMSDGAGTLLLDICKRQWSARLLTKLDLDPELLPPVVESPTVIGGLTSAAARALGLQRDIPVVAGAGDQAAAAIGTGVVRPGIVSATMGTSGVVFAHSADPVPNQAGLLQSFCHAVSNAWCVFGCMLSAGGSFQWLREVLYADAYRTARGEAERDQLYARMISEAAHTDDDDSDPLVFQPYLTGERCPHPHPHARGSFIGLTRRHTRGRLVRSVLEGITFGMAQQIQLMRDAQVPVKEVRLAGGGARSAWWRQLQADAYGVRCVTMKTEEGSAMGAAILAAVGAGAFRTVPAACKALVTTKSEHRPDKKRHAQLQQRLALTADLYSQIEPLYRTQF